MQRLVLTTLLAIAALLVMVSSARAGSVEIVFDRESNRLGIQVSETPLPLLIGQLAEATGIQFQVDASLSEERLSLNRTPVRTEEALRQLLRHYSHIIQYGRDTRGRARIQSVVVLARGDKTTTLEFPARSSEVIRPMEVSHDSPVHGTAVSAVNSASPSTANTELEGAAVSVAVVQAPPDPTRANTALENFSGTGSVQTPINPPSARKRPIPVDAVNLNR